MFSQTAQSTAPQAYEQFCRCSRTMLCACLCSAASPRRAACRHRCSQNDTIPEPHTARDVPHGVARQRLPPVVQQLRKLQGLEHSCSAGFKFSRGLRHPSPSEEGEGVARRHDSAHHGNVRSPSTGSTPRKHSLQWLAALSLRRSYSTYIMKLRCQRDTAAVVTANKKSSPGHSDETVEETGYVMCPNQEHRSFQPTTYVFATVSRMPPANYLEWCLRGAIMGTWRLVESLATCVRPLCAITAVPVIMWLDSAVKGVALSSATTRDHQLLLYKRAGAVVALDARRVCWGRLPENRLQ
ncbi:hypothetical protein HPB51_017324 [Rhipicephalus microplus]|uniref:Uncharacterized protein n=1 Tax=Rhipicephalus microplus TaxID=6941 RepID=A0A9J6EUP7_RHIMP|nr:hypothetical protein HPB51_017324 [Rhipicephalus microplus]